MWVTIRNSAWFGKTDFCEWLLLTQSKHFQLCSSLTTAASVGSTEPLSHTLSLSCWKGMASHLGTFTFLLVWVFDFSPNSVEECRPGPERRVYSVKCRWEDRSADSQTDWHTWVTVALHKALHPAAFLRDPQPLKPCACVCVCVCDPDVPTYVLTRAGNLCWCGKMVSVAGLTNICTVVVLNILLHNVKIDQIYAKI